MKNRTPRPDGILLIALPLLFCAACNNGGGGSKGSTPAFLLNETQLDSSGTDDARDAELHADGQTVYALYVDLKSGFEELYFNRSSDGGATWLPMDVHIPGDPAGPLGVDPTGRKLAFDGDDLVVVFEESDDMFSNVSHDGGLTWNASATRIDPGPSEADDSDDPTALYLNGVFHALWMDEFGGSTGAYYSRSTDLGETWTVASKINHDAANVEEPRITSAVAGPLYAIWADDRNDPGGDESLFFTRSSDDGQTWLVADVQACEGVGDAGSARIAANGSTVYLAFLGNQSGDDNVYFQRSLDGGDTWAVADVRLDATAPGTSSEEVLLAADGNVVAVAWSTPGAGGDDDLFLTVSTDAGVTWLPSPLRLDEGASGVGDSDDLQIAVVGQTVVATWEDTAQGLDDIFLCYSKDGGASWSDVYFAEEIAPGSAAASAPALAVSGTSAWVAWHEDRTGDLDVFVNGGQLPDVP